MAKQTGIRTTVARALSGLNDLRTMTEWQQRHLANGTMLNKTTLSGATQLIHGMMTLTTSSVRYNNQMRTILLHSLTAIKLNILQRINSFDSYFPKRRHWTAQLFNKAFDSCRVEIFARGRIDGVLWGIPEMHCWSLHWPWQSSVCTCISIYHGGQGWVSESEIKTAV